jgi:RND superfamily putative drug exporter
VTALSRPRLTLLIAVGVLAVCALGVTTYTEDVNVVGQFRTDTDSTQGYALLQKGFSPGAVNPNTVLIERSGGALSPRDVRSVQDTLRGVAGVDSVTGLNVVSRDGRAGTLVATFKDDPFQPPALHRIGVIRDRLGKLGSQGLHVIVGDGTALRVDYRDAAAADQLKVAPLALLVITLMLIGLLRAIVAPLYLLATTVLSFLATLGISLVVFDKVFGEPTVDPALPLLTFVFLVALGVDYNIFLMDRVREEAREHGTREGVLRALVATGPVITSAGIVLAGTFAVLSILPLDILLELGFAVALGVMLDTFFVRTLIVPALVTVFGDASWWPSKLRPRAPAGGPLAQQPPPPGPVLPAVAGQPPPRR